MIDLHDCNHTVKFTVAEYNLKSLNRILKSVDCEHPCFYVTVSDVRTEGYFDVVDVTIEYMSSYVYLGTVVDGEVYLMPETANLAADLNVNDIRSARTNRRLKHGIITYGTIEKQCCAFSKSVQEMYVEDCDIAMAKIHALSLM